MSESENGAAKEILNKALQNSQGDEGGDTDLHIPPEPKFPRAEVTFTGDPAEPVIVILEGPWSMKAVDFTIRSLRRQYKLWKREKLMALQPDEPKPVEEPVVPAEVKSPERSPIIEGSTGPIAVIGDKPLRPDVAEAIQKTAASIAQSRADASRRAVEAAIEEEKRKGTK